MAMLFPRAFYAEHDGENFTDYWEGPMIAHPNTILLAVVVGPSPAISGPPGITWYPCGGSGRLKLFYALPIDIPEPEWGHERDPEYKMEFTARAALIQAFGDIDTTIGVGGMVNFASGSGTSPFGTGLPDTAYKEVISNGGLSYNKIVKLVAANMYHSSAGRRGIYTIPNCAIVFGDLTGLSIVDGNYRYFPDGFPSPPPDLQEVDEFYLAHGEFDGCGPFAQDFEARSDSSSPPGSYDLAMVYFVRTSSDTCPPGGTGPT
jgi:hypothetical protein